MLTDRFLLFYVVCFLYLISDVVYFVKLYFTYLWRTLTFRGHIGFWPIVHLQFYQRLQKSLGCACESLIHWFHLTQLFRLHVVCSKNEIMAQHLHKKWYAVSYSFPRAEHSGSVEIFITVKFLLSAIWPVSRLTSKLPWTCLFKLGAKQVAFSLPCRNVVAACIQQ